MTENDHITSALLAVVIIIIIIIIQHLYSAIMSYADTEALEIIIIICCRPSDRVKIET